MPGTIKSYDPAQVLTVFSAVPLVGYAPGSFIKVSRNSEMFKVHVGSDGEGARSKSNDKSGTVSVTLMQSSPSNDVLSGFAAADELAGAGVGPLLIKDNSGRTVVMAQNAWVKKLPDNEFGQELGQREWVFETDDLEVFTGGSGTN